MNKVRLTRLWTIIVSIVDLFYGKLYLNLFRCSEPIKRLSFSILKNPRAFLNMGLVIYFK